MNKRANELTQKLETYGRLKNNEYVELKHLINDGALPEWHQLYLSQRVDLHMMNCLTTEILWKVDDTGYNPFFDMKQLVEMVNAWFEIDNPYKAPNKIAYGWQFAVKKGFDSFRPYLFGCIRNYLKKNDVEYTNLELQIICSLKDVVKSNGEDWEDLPDNAY